MRPPTQQHWGWQVGLQPPPGSALCRRPNTGPSNPGIRAPWLQGDHAGPGLSKSTTPGVRDVQGLGVPSEQNSHREGTRVRHPLLHRAGPVVRQRQEPWSQGCLCLHPEPALGTPLPSREVSFCRTGGVGGTPRTRGNGGRRWAAHQVEQGCSEFTAMRWDLRAQ